MKYYSVTLLLLITCLVSAQTDTLNKLNAQSKKDGYWKVFLDDKLNKTDSINSFFYGYELYENGIPVFKFPKGESGRKKKINYNFMQPQKGSPQLISGIFKRYYKNAKAPYSEEEYLNGKPVCFKSFNFYHQSDSLNYLFEKVDFTQRYRNLTGSATATVYLGRGKQEILIYCKGKKGWDFYPYKNPDMENLSPLILQPHDSVGKIKTIPSDLEINIESSVTDTCGPKTTYSGNFYKLKGDSLIINVKSEVTSTRYFFNCKSEIDYHCSTTYPNGHLTSIAIQNINSIEYEKFRWPAGIGAFLSGGGIFGALIIAPLASINLKNGDFNQKKYYSILAGCGIAVAASFPLHLIFKMHHNFQIKPNKNYSKSRTYRLVSP